MAIVEGLAPLEREEGIPGCAGTAYSEALPTTASLTDLTFSASDPKPYVLTALDRRFPAGKAVLEGGAAINPTSASNCFAFFLGNPQSAKAALSGAATAVHECGHIYDNSLAKSPQSAYFVLPREVHVLQGRHDDAQRNDLREESAPR